MIWEELNSKQLKQAAVDCNGACVLPLGVIEKHGDHLPLGTDMYIGRTVCEMAAKIESIVVFPYFFLGQILEARHCPGTIALKASTILAVLEEVCEEIARNGFHKIIIVSSHGGNSSFLSFFAQSMLEKEREYLVYISEVLSLKEKQKYELINRFGTINLGSHAGLKETALMLSIQPDLVNMEAQNPDISDALERDKKLIETGLSTGFSWYSNYPYHYAGDHTNATKEMGDIILKMKVENLVEAIHAVKNDKVTSTLANEFYSLSEDLLKKKER